jgi:hypothetical protein
MLDLDAERAHRLDGPQAIVARKKPAHDADAVGESANDDGAVGNAFVARDGNFSFDPRRAFDPKFHERRSASREFAGLSSRAISLLPPALLFSSPAKLVKP